jgi:hypothetical protein
LNFASPKSYSPAWDLEAGRRDCLPPPKRRDRLIVPRSVSLLPEQPILNDAGSKKTIRLETDRLARRLLIYESKAGKSSEPGKSPTLRVYEKLRQNLGAFAGIAGFKSLASRALALARSEDPGFSKARVAEDGTLQGLGEIEHQVDFDNEAVGEPSSEAGIILIARLLGLLHIFLGETLTARLLRVTWPGAALDDCNSGTGETREHTG